MGGGDRSTSAKWVWGFSWVKGGEKKTVKLQAKNPAEDAPKNLTEVGDPKQTALGL